MIRISRGPEPTSLAPIRNAQLLKLRALGRPPTSKEIDGYKVVGAELWKAQHSKCCYCEFRIGKGFNDVEHYRPKATADRKPGCTDTHGYWWLAFTWENLLFSCPACNRSHKKTAFPLKLGCSALVSENAPPGSEHPLLLDPGSTTNPIEHIEFVYVSIGKTSATRHWWARPRDGSVYGSATIEACGLNRSELRELRERHYTDVVLPHARAIKDAVSEGSKSRLQNEFSRALDLLRPSAVHVGMTFDAFRAEVPGAAIKSLIGHEWPQPSAVA